MTKWIGAAVLAATLMFGVTAVVPPACAASAEVQKASPSQATDISGRRHYRHYAYRPYYPYYYGHPYYYSPGPFLPFPSFFSYGWERW